MWFLTDYVKIFAGCCTVVWTGIFSWDGYQYFYTRFSRSWRSLMGLRYEMVCLNLGFNKSRCHFWHLDVPLFCPGVCEVRLAWLQSWAQNRYFVTITLIRYSVPLLVTDYMIFNRLCENINRVLWIPIRNYLY